ncbi:hypothetical protein J25TS5_48350 [Paenibacillus faecis]|nr:hypothetical protein J25TS5_48350 [Paenibacillus faecis]
MEAGEHVIIRKETHILYSNALRRNLCAFYRSGGLDSVYVSVCPGNEGGKNDE